MTKPVIIRKVWSENLTDELLLIRSIIKSHRFVAMDMEFPGNIFEAAVKKHEHKTLPPDYNYAVMKKNVDSLKPIQLGLAFSDGRGKLPDFGTQNSFVWEFNFSDFDIDCDQHNLDSINLLQRQGIDFDENSEFGISSMDFVTMIWSTGLIYMFPKLYWVTFQGSYDFGYLIKILTQSLLPDDIDGFKGLVRGFFGVHVYDIKHIMKSCQGLYGGLEKVASTLGVVRVAGTSHQAGSDSLLTLQAFFKLTETYYNGRKEKIVRLGSAIQGLGYILVEENHQPIVSFDSPIQGYNCPQARA